uniref:Zinc finger C2H2 LYAR-type domain-containing protein n=1 Tax=Trieres chinensis TaxID=1514140 RepID=A0A7S2A780_TRICV|mmetsp:Transcript_5580/g.11620  ORF Transcript_5580/g.11620 Transcript_5580/m.11620 type:complete len:282 (+) Transcript_5580:74-919(+)|eukprot:CAMPEP_0183303736 /NCGR_PEP_ID=MMETSP0160_2-20130417/9070_1 /TAXON_ID=2839 ORGANISM="Odontella Sinensis, Strain Grunow 1884" /NCGR_SAMPLE_ID=MMETSP0160_2 /ASSEMBLY_ACC=CAM_ASM_000250 /LENGTH=281 /DNA_ID=CAMNT_0025466683 /DNA_START=50 /DNA_END=895 /DNA_ORIENTATION=-
MVFFSCDGCGEMLKKNQVDAHVYKCRSGCESVSCVDCSVSFYGDDYRTHTTCISEAERYEKTVYRGPKKGEANKSKKLTPQEAWMQIISIAAESAPSSIRQNMIQLAALDNVPRKEKQFRNFTTNSLRLRHREAGAIVDAMWKHLSKVREDEKKKKEGQQSGEATESNTTPNNPVEKQKSEEKIMAETPDHSGRLTNKPKNCDALSGEKASSKLVKKAMKKALKKAPKRKMKLKELRKEVQVHLVWKGDKKDLENIIMKQITANKKIKKEGKTIMFVDDSM